MLHAVILLAILAGTPVVPDSELRSTVRWMPETFATMSFLYQRITAVPDGVEFAACLRAHREGNVWIVTEVVIPRQSGNTSSGIGVADCSGYEGTAHSHPLWQHRRTCFPSFGDRASFAASPNEFLVVWCDVEAFTYRTKDLGIGGKDDTTPDPGVSTSAEPYLWRGAPSAAE